MVATMWLQSECFLIDPWQHLEFVKETIFLYHLLRLSWLLVRSHPGPEIPSLVEVLAFIFNIFFFLFAGFYSSEWKIQIQDFCLLLFSSQRFRFWCSNLHLSIWNTSGKGKHFNWIRAWSTGFFRWGKKALSSFSLGLHSSGPRP